MRERASFVQARRLLRRSRPRMGRLREELSQPFRHAERENDEAEERGGRDRPPSGPPERGVRRGRYGGARGRGAIDDGRSETLVNGLPADVARAPLLPVDEAPLQDLRDLAGRGVAVVRGLGMKPGDDRLEPGGRLRNEVADRTRLVVNDLEQDPDRIRVSKRRAAGVEAVEHAPQAEEVGPRVEPQSLRCSGDMKFGVPEMRAVRVTLVSLSERARPKSVDPDPVESFLQEDVARRCRGG